MDIHCIFRTVRPRGQAIFAMMVCVLLSACAAPAMMAPRTPIHLENVIESTVLEKVDLDTLSPDTISGAEVTEKHGEILLADHAFRPGLKAALRAFIDRELGQAHAGRPLIISRMSVKIRYMAAYSDTAGTIHAPAVQGAPPGAGLVGAIIATAIIEGAKNSGNHERVLASVEGEYGGIAFAGFAHLPYRKELPHDSIKDTVLAAFNQAGASIKSRLLSSNPDGRRIDSN